MAIKIPQEKREIAQYPGNFITPDGKVYRRHRARGIEIDTPSGITADGKVFIQGEKGPWFVSVKALLMATFPELTEMPELEVEEPMVELESEEPTDDEEYEESDVPDLEDDE